MGVSATAKRLGVLGNRRAAGVSGDGPGCRCVRVDQLPRQGDRRIGQQPALLADSQAAGVLLAAVQAVGVYRRQLPRQGDRRIRQQPERLVSLAIVGCWRVR